MNKDEVTKKLKRISENHVVKWPLVVFMLSAIFCLTSSAVHHLF